MKYKYTTVKKKTLGYKMTVKKSPLVVTLDSKACSENCKACEILGVYYVHDSKAFLSCPASTKTNREISKRTGATQ